MAKRRKHRYGSPPAVHRRRGITSARRAIKLAKAAMRTGCGSALGLLVTAAEYAGKAESDAEGQITEAKLGRRNRLAFKTANRADKAVRNAMTIVKAHCFRSK